MLSEVRDVKHDRTSEAAHYAVEVNNAHKGPNSPFPTPSAMHHFLPDRQADYPIQLVKRCCARYNLRSLETSAGKLNAVRFNNCYPSSL